MTKYQEKLLRGETPSDADWNEYLRASHEVAPSMTPEAFAAPLSNAGLNSYQTLVRAFEGAGNPKRVLDLACGDGHLSKYIRQEFGDAVNILGVDMSERELSQAQKQYGAANVKFRKESASAIQEADGSFDLVLCHMAFMLMTPLEPVVREVARVLKPGGSFIGVVGGSAATSGFLPVYRRLYLDFMQRKFPLYKPFAGGDPRITKSEGILSVLAPPLFRDTEIRDFSVTVHSSVEEIWLFFKEMYNVTLLPEREREEFRAEVVQAARAQADAEGKFTFEFPMRLFKTRRA